VLFAINLLKASFDLVSNTHTSKIITRNKIFAVYFPESSLVASDFLRALVIPLNIVNDEHKQNLNSVFTNDKIKLIDNYIKIVKLIFKVRILTYFFIF
jgi:hypothetical protein